jgi:fructose-bisphosphate aldolase class II/tagatose 1,6-diphosphate aldolase GatY/KbaY
VLHGSSGIPATSIAEAVNRGICKINLATEIKNIFMLTLKSQLQNNDEIDLRKVFPPAIESITKLVEEKLLIAENKSPGHE